MILLDLINGQYWDVLIYMSVSFGVFCLVLLAVGVDLYFGIKKSKQDGRFIHSYGLKRTISKLTEYLANMFLLFLIDLINPMWLIVDFQKIPIFSVFIGIVLIFIELKSVREKSSKKFVNATAETSKEVMRYVIDNKKVIKGLIQDLDEMENKKKR